MTTTTTVATTTTTAVSEGCCPHCGLPSRPVATAAERAYLTGIHLAVIHGALTRTNHTAHPRG